MISRRKPGPPTWLHPHCSASRRYAVNVKMGVTKEVLKEGE